MNAFLSQKMIIFKEEIKDFEIKEDTKYLGLVRVTHFDKKIICKRRI